MNSFVPGSSLWREKNQRRVSVGFGWDGCSTSQYRATSVWNSSQTVKLVIFFFQIKLLFKKIRTCFNPTCCLLYRPEWLIFSRKCSKSHRAARAGLCGQQPDSPEGKYSLENSRSCSHGSSVEFPNSLRPECTSNFQWRCANLNTIITKSLDL